jgi:cytochrome c-type biogenesis protein CcmI
MLTFWIICGLMVLFTLWFVLPPLLQREPETKADESRDASLLVYQDQYQELEADLKNGLIEEPQYQQEKESLERRLLDEMSSKRRASTPSGTRTPRKLAYAVAIALPVAAILFYFLVGNPKVLNLAPSNQTTTQPR